MILGIISPNKLINGSKIMTLKEALETIAEYCK